MVDVQFIAERQCDMEKWVTVLNAATRTVEAQRECSEWPRQLPQPPTAQETYDQPDSAVRPVLEAEYELPDVLLRPHRAQVSHTQENIIPKHSGNHLLKSGTFFYLVHQ